MFLGASPSDSDKLLLWFDLQEIQGRLKPRETGQHMWLILFSTAPFLPGARLKEKTQFAFQLSKVKLIPLVD